MDRRRFLTSSLAVAALTGCVGSSSDGDATPRETTERRETTTKRATAEATSTETDTVDGGERTTTENGSDGPSEVRIALDYMWADNEAAVVDALRDAGLSEDIEVSIVAGTFESGSRRRELRAILEQERPDPDIFMMDTGWTVPFVARGDLVNLSEAMSAETLSYVEEAYMDSIVRTVRRPETGALYGLPLFADYPVMHYRKDLVEAAGYDPEGESWATEPMTWQRFATVAAEAWEQSGVEYGFTTQGEDYEGTACCTFNEMMTSWGGAYFGDHEHLFGPVGDRPITVDEQPVRDTIRMMRSFMYGPDAEHAHPDFPRITTDDLTDFTEEDARRPFTQGEAVFMRNWPYAVEINLERGEFDESDYGSMPMPYRVEEGAGNYQGTGGTSHALGGWNLTVNPHSENVEDAVAVLEAFTEESVMRTVLQEMGTLPPVPDLLERIDPSTTPFTGEHLETFAVAARNAVPRPVTRAWPDESPLISGEIHAAYTGRKSPGQAMSDLDTALRGIERQ